jgi:hypothetical protein
MAAMDVEADFASLDTGGATDAAAEAVAPAKTAPMATTAKQVSCVCVARSAQ